MVSKCSYNMPLGRSKKTEVFKSNMAPNPLVCADDVNVLGESYVLRKKDKNGIEPTRCGFHILLIYDPTCFGLRNILGKTTRPLHIKNK